MTTTIIVGGVAGGMSTATRLRRRDENMNIIVFEASNHVSYANCGLPYYVGNVIENRDALLLHTPASLKDRFNIDVRVGHRVTSIDTNARTVTVTTGENTVTENYDYLVLSPGATPVRPPIPGIERALSLRTVEDVDTIVAQAQHASTAVVIGGGFIGVELAENLHHRGIATTIIEQGPQILPVFDPEMAGPLTHRMRAAGIKVRTGTTATTITDESVTTDSGETIPADLVIAAIGVRPDTTLATSSGLRIGPRGGIVVDHQLRTSNERIFALGDAIEKTDFVSNEPALIPLAQTANRHGRIIADVITGRDTCARPTQGTAIIGVCGMAAATTGWSEKRARAAGKNIRVVHVHPMDHAGYYPGATPVHLKLIIDSNDAILGAQAVGENGVDKRIDVIATAQRASYRASDLADLELAYAPQFGSAKDAVNIAGMVADNQAQGEQTVHWHELHGQPLIDVRTPEEFSRGHIPGALNIPLDQLREQVHAIPHGAILYCQVGLRGHIATTIAHQWGRKVANLSGGYLTWAHAQQAS